MKTEFKSPLRLTAVLAALAGAAVSPAATESLVPPGKAEYLRLANEVEANLQTQILDKFFPAAIGEAGGGFFENFAVDWARRPGEARSIVYQSRLTWTSAQAAERYPARADSFRSATRHGATFLAATMWDQNGGGFHWSVGPDGRPAEKLKQMYGHAFGIYSLAACYHATKDQAALALAKKGFQWLEEHAHDPVNLGYYESIGPDGKPPKAGQANVVGAAVGQKSMNTSIHILEALTGLYQVWPDPLVKTRLAEMLDLCRNRIYAEPGYLVQFLSADWKPTLSPDSFGHDVETAYLMVEAAEVLGKGGEQTYWQAGRQLVDHAMRCGWDKERGGLYDSAVINAGGEVTGAVRTEKIWWVEAEHLNALLLLHDRYGKETTRYWEAFVKQWGWIRQCQVDGVHGGWWPTVEADGKPASRVKADMWTECYHQARAMLVVSERLRRMAGD